MVNGQECNDESLELVEIKKVVSDLSADSKEKHKVFWSWMERTIFATNRF